MVSPLKLAKGITRHIVHKVARILRPKASFNVPAQTIGDPSCDSFIGYYDIQPFSADESQVLIHRYDGKKLIEVGFYDLDKESFTRLGSVKSWCWQQGCRLQWINWKGSQHISYNTQEDGEKLITRILNPKGEEVATLDHPTYSFSSDLKYAVSLDFNYLEFCRSGYGYADPNKDFSQTFQTKLDIYDLERISLLTSITTEQAAAINPHETMSDPKARHYFNHVHFNPSATRLMVFHIWDINGKRRVRALTMNPDGTEIHDVTGGTHVSHYWWLDDDHLIFYGTDPQRGMGYHIYHERKGYIRTLDKNMPKIDGHPSRHPINPDIIVSDNVVNRISERDLWLYDMGTEKRTMIAYFYSPPHLNGPTRCDLHPRFSPLGNYVAIDSAHNDYREVVILDVRDLV